MTLPPDNRAYTAHSDWAEMAYFHARYLEATIANHTDLPPVAVQWINGSDDVDTLAAKARRAKLPFLALHTIGCTREDVLFPREAGRGTGRTAQKANDQESWTEKEDPGMFFETHLDAMDIQVVLQKLTTMQVYRALVVYDAEFAIHGLGPLKEQAESHNFTLSFVPLEANRTRVKEVINQTLWRLKQINSYFTSFAMLLFSSFTIADRLEAELIDEGVLDPSMRTLAFYSGFDLGLSGRYKQHHIRYPYEKVIYVILRRFHEKARKLLKTATAQRNSEDKALSFADCFAVVFLNVIMEYMSSVRLPETMDCGTAMDDFLEGMKKNLTSEMKTLRMHSSTIRYYTFYLAPIRSKVYRLKHVDTWKQKDGRLERTIVMTEVEAYLKNREIKVALQETENTVGPTRAVQGSGKRVTQFRSQTR
ncbi:hypothetical protein HPB48_010561 [Haemaphysalis longicornis]|uniref:Uncharacterized protein n=1 Tax=Haemaphysalis longicornis TaxID=44386 RepID=A0A9J6GT94_HAELO|nr:hypothetical protein HPB48_010561 [Haemaphysalis longicornis]